MDIIYSLITVIMGMIMGFICASLLNSKLKRFKYFFAALGVILLVIPTFFIALYCAIKVNGLFVTIFAYPVTVTIYLLGMFYGIFIKSTLKTTVNTNKNTQKIKIYTSLFVVFVPLCLWIYSSVYYSFNAYNALFIAALIFFVMLIITVIIVSAYALLKRLSNNKKSRS